METLKKNIEAAREHLQKNGRDGLMSMRYFGENDRSATNTMRIMINWFEEKIDPGARLRSARNAGASSAQLRIRQHLNQRVLRWHPKWAG